MLRSLVCSFVVLAMSLALASAQGDKDKKDTKDKKDQEAKITKVDTKAKSVTLKMKDDNGKDLEKTFKLAEDIQYMDSTGKVASLDIFVSGDTVLMIEREGMVTRLKKKDNPDTKKKDSK